MLPFFCSDCENDSFCLCMPSILPSPYNFIKDMCYINNTQISVRINYVKVVIIIRYSLTDSNYHFKYFFDSRTGAYIRSGILDQNGNDTGVDPFRGSFPHLIDVGIMGHCTHGKSGLCVKGGVQCYQSGLFLNEPNMRIEDFSEVVKQCRGKVNQFALGGRGDPDQHEHFEEILKLCRENEIVPNFTTSGYGMTGDIAALCKEYCGAVAVSWYRNEYTLKTIDMLCRKGVVTNIHYVLGNNSIDEAVHRLKNNDFPKGINSVVFLLHKPVGQGSMRNVLSPDDPRIREFFGELDKGNRPFKIGADSCCVPGLINFCSNVIPEVIEPCEGGRFSCYISPDMCLLPCSFDQKRKYAVSLRDYSIEEAWNSRQFDEFRRHLRIRCPDCNSRENCMGGCPLIPEVVLCNRKEKITNLSRGESKS